VGLGASQEGLSSIELVIDTLRTRTLGIRGSMSKDDNFS
jgi:hypothetical protein